jgi:hypothetical protein
MKVECQLTDGEGHLESHNTKGNSNSNTSYDMKSQSRSPAFASSKAERNLVY